MLLVDLGFHIATEAVEMEAGRFTLGHDARDDGLDSAGQQVWANGDVVAALGPPSAVDLDHVGVRSDLVERIHVAEDVLGGENPAVVVPGRPPLVVGGFERLDSVLRRNGAAELVEHVEPVFPALEDDWFVLYRFARLELLALAIGPDHQRVVLLREVRQEDAP